ncbi:MAG: hypothetical protein ACQKBY_04915 [Verrucomicrobiales bacterium]
MSLAEPLAINFHLPASDPLGKNHVLGKLRFLPDHVELSWQLKGSVFRGGEGELRQIQLPYTEIEHVALVKRWFRLRSLDFRVSNPALVQEIPGVNMGKMSLEIDERSREEAKKLHDYIDFQRSIFRLDAQNARLAALRE